MLSGTENTLPSSLMRSCRHSHQLAGRMQSSIMLYLVYYYYTLVFSHLSMYSEGKCFFNVYMHALCHKNQQFTDLQMVCSVWHREKSNLK